MAYKDVVLATPSLIHLWPLGPNAAAADDNLVGASPLTLGSALVWDPATGTGDIPDPAVAARFNRASAANNQAIAAPAALSGAHSIEVLFKIPSGGTSVGWYLFGTRGSTPGYSTEWTVEADAGGSASLRHNMGNGSAWYSPPGAGYVVRDRWHHAIFAIGADGSWEMFLNGISIGTGVWALSGTPLLFDATHNLTIGNYSRTYDANWSFQGWMQMFAIYNTKLDLATAEAHAAGFPPSILELASPEINDFGPPLTAILLSPAMVAEPGGGEGSPRPVSGQTWPR